MEDLETSISGLVKELKIWVDNVQAVETISKLLENTQKGNGKIILIPNLVQQQEVEILLPGYYNVSPVLAQHIKVINGVEKVDQF